MAETIDPKVEKATREFCQKFARLREEIGKAIVGHTEIVDGVLTCLFVGGHALLEGVPGLGKTYLIRTLSEALSLDFNRIQFTPDLMPADIIGTNIVMDDPATGRREFRFQHGPIFAQIVLADEINRATPKTQSALLEAMQEHAVTVGGTRYPLEEPFFVMATQNPIEQEGTYPLPEAQQDRFMFKILVPYPSWDEEFAVMRGTGARAPRPEPVLDAREILELQDLVARVPVADYVVHYAMRLARATRVGHDETPAFIAEWVRWGVGPRACQQMIQAARARALLRGRPYAGAEDIDAVAAPIMRHRLVTTFTAASEGVTPDDVVARLIEHTPAHDGDLSHDEQVQQVLRPRDAR